MARRSNRTYAISAGLSCGIGLAVPVVAFAATLPFDGPHQIVAAGAVPFAVGALAGVGTFALAARIVERGESDADDAVSYAHPSAAFTEHEEADASERFFGRHGAPKGVPIIARAEGAPSEEEAWAEIDELLNDDSPISCDPARSKDIYEIALEELRRGSAAASGVTPGAAASAGPAAWGAPAAAAPSAAQTGDLRRQAAAYGAASTAVYMALAGRAATMPATPASAASTHAAYGAAMGAASAAYGAGVTGSVPGAAPAAGAARPMADTPAAGVVGAYGAANRQAGSNAASSFGAGAQVPGAPYGAAAATAAPYGAASVYGTASRPTAPASGSATFPQAAAQGGASAPLNRTAPAASAQQPAYPYGVAGAGYGAAAASRAGAPAEMDGDLEAERRAALASLDYMEDGSVSQSAAAAFAARASQPIAPIVDSSRGAAGVRPAGAVPQPGAGPASAAQVSTADFAGHEDMWAQALSILADEPPSSVKSPGAAEGARANRVHEHVNSLIEEEFNHASSSSVRHTSHEYLRVIQGGTASLPRVQAEA